MTIICKYDLSGTRYGRLTVIKFFPTPNKNASFLCLCDCGKETIQYGFHLKSGAVLSCGCYGAEQRIKSIKIHGQASNHKRTRTYTSWASMMDRCHWGGHKKMFARYGEKGRIVCERWHSFENFYADMGDRPENTSLDRVDNNGNYEPSNCRWADRKTQAMNTSRTVKVIYKNSVRKVKELIEELNIPAKAFRSRAVRRGNDYVLAFKSYGIDCDYA